MLENAFDIKTDSSQLKVLEYAEQLLEMPSTIIGGSWFGAEDGPTIRQAGILYSSPVMAPPEPLSSIAKIIKVKWRWCVEGYQNNVKVYLCDINQAPGCLDISKWTEGEADVFNDRCANHQFKLCFYVPGERDINPVVVGKNIEVTVNWKTPKWREQMS